MHPKGAQDVLSVRGYEASDARAWDELVGVSPGGNFLHSRRFLAYHGNRFKDASLVVERDGKLIAVFPAAFDTHDPQHIISHPGATYGGLIAPGFPASDVVAALLAIARHYQCAGVARLTYKTVPLHLTSVPSQADRYALWLLGATLGRRDLWSVVWAREDPRQTKHLRRQLRIAQQHRLEAFESNRAEDYERYHVLLSNNLEERHGVLPAHSAAELIDLRQRLGDAVGLWLVSDGQREAPVAGVWLFRFGKVAWHTQYIASTPDGRKKRAVHFLLHHLLTETRAQGVAALSYGAVTEEAGRVINTGLERFKIEFGGGLVIHDFFTLSLTAALPQLGDLLMAPEF